MENMEFLPRNNKQSNLGITNESSTNLREIGKWSRFLSSLGFIYIFLFIAIGLLNVFLATRVNTASLFFAYLMSIIPLIIIAIPLVYLYKFSDNLSKGYESNNAVFYTEAFRYFRAYYKYIGILVLIVLIFYFFFFCFALVSFFTSSYLY